MKLYNGDILVAELRDDHHVHLVEGLEEEYVPRIIFGGKFDRVSKVPFPLFMKFIEGRIIHKDQDGVELFLESIGLKEFDIVEIIKATQARSSNDNLRVIL